MVPPRCSPPNVLILYSGKKIFSVDNQNEFSIESAFELFLNTLEEKSPEPKGRVWHPPVTDAEIVVETKR
jgi:hypothetical protein